MCYVGRLKGGRLLGKRGMNPKQAEDLRIRQGIDRGTNLRIKRVEKGWSQSELANISGVNIKTLRLYEQREEPLNSAKLKTLCALCIALGCRIEDILESEELKEKYRIVK